MQAIFNMDGLPALHARLDKIAVIVANPITHEALKAGGAIIKKMAEEKVHRLTGALQGDIVVVTRVRGGAASAEYTATAPERYVLIGPGWNPDLYRRTTARSRGANNRDLRPDYTTNPGVYGYFLEVGHRAPGKGLANLPDYRRDARILKKQGKKLNAYTNPSSLNYGSLTVPAYPWLRPAFDEGKDQAFAEMGRVINDRLGGLGLV